MMFVVLCIIAQSPLQCTLPMGNAKRLQSIGEQLKAKTLAQLQSAPCFS